MPAISVVMAVYNGEKYLKEAVDSILNQTFTDFEFIIIDDGSTDQTPQILQSYRDKRIQIVKNNKNLGIAKSRNKGMEIATGTYIAHMDADDISLPQRLAKQYQFMELNPEIDVSSGRLKYFGSKTKTSLSLIAHEEIVTSFFWRCSIKQTASIVRRKRILELREYYSSDFNNAEDIEYWIRLFLKGAKFANLDETLVKYRTHTQNVSVVHRQLQKLKSLNARLQVFKKLDFSDPHKELETYTTFRYGKKLNNFEILKVSAWVEELLKANAIKEIFPEEEMRKQTGENWFKFCYNSCNNGLFTWRAFHNNPVSDYCHIGTKQKLLFLGKCLVKKYIY